MSLLKFVERLKRMDNLILTQQTGNAKEFANKMNISSSQLFKDIRDMKVLGAPIKYSREVRSYCYSKNCMMILDFLEKENILVNDH
jgi:predicted DNA-binding transcriptional regulator YafY